MLRSVTIMLFSIAVACATPTPAGAQGIRLSPVSYHMSFDNRDFFDEDFIEISGKKSIDERKIDFPEGRFGKGIRMSFVPAPPDADNMSGIDLDLVTAVIFNTKPGNTMGYNEPFIWGSGRINTRLGSAAFWAKGKSPYAAPLFEQTTIAFGRKERDLLGVLLGDDMKISAYLRDARYVRHELKTDVVWDTERWNHVVLNWDWANGLELWLNGEKIASSWGTDGWFDTVPPGLFHLPTSGMTYDEVYLMDRPLSKGEIARLIKDNRPPAEESPVFTRKNPDSDRIVKLAGADRSENLPALEPEKGITFTEVFPGDAYDGHIPGLYAIDGRNEIAWPHEYAFFTIIPGDADFHAEKVDVPTPADASVNYVTVTGNLTNVRVQAGSSGMSVPDDLFAVPSGDRFMYASTVTARQGATFRIPFTERYGLPEGYQGDVVRLPISGEKRVHNIGLYHVAAGAAKEAEYWPVTLDGGSLDARTTFAVHAVTSRDERVIAVAKPERGSGRAKTTDIGSFRRIHILSEPFESPKGVASVTLSLPVRTKFAEETLYVRVHDPAVPLRLWNQFAVRLDGFDGGFKTINLTIDFNDLVLTGGDRLWIDIGTPRSCEVRLGDAKAPAMLGVTKVPAWMAVDVYADKEIIAARAQYSKMYEFMPWRFTGREVSLENPYCYGGPFDMYMPALAVLRVKPDHFIAQFLKIMCGSESGIMVVDGRSIDRSKVALRDFDNPFGAPDWAVYMHEYNTFRHRIADWWAENQNPDGQVGGGWNDDTLFISFHQADLPLDGNANARAVIDTVHTKFEATGLFKDGYCRIYPIDRMHTGDFISERYNTVVNNLGQAYAAEREMESAWRLGHPDETPVNFAQGIAFRTSVNVFNWYWGKDLPDKPYVSPPLDTVTNELRLYASVCNDLTFFRYTESNVHRDDYSPYGAGTVYRYLLGGSRGARWDAHVNLAVMWPSGGGPDVARIIQKADDRSLTALCYSFDEAKRDLAMRLCRIKDGRYRVGVYEDPSGTGVKGSTLWEREMDIRRLDIVTLPIPPHRPVMIAVEQIAPANRPAVMPDLAVDPWDAVRSGSTVAVTVHNLGNAAADRVTVRLMNGDGTVADTVIPRIDAPTDFVAKKTTVRFSGVPESQALHVMVDPDGAVTEILEENNAAAVR